MTSLPLFYPWHQVSAVTDQNGMQEAGGNAGDFDDDEGGGLVSTVFLKNKIAHNLNFFY